MTQPEARSEAPRRLLPTPGPLTAPYWEAVQRHRLALPWCTACGRPHFYPRSLCPFCRSDALEWRDASGRGTVYSFTTVHRAPSDAFADEVPYVVAVVELAEGPHLMTRIVNLPPEEVRIGAPVRAVFLDRGGPVPLPCFESAP